MKASHRATSPSEQVKVNTGNIRTKFKICSKLTIKRSCLLFSWYMTQFFKSEYHCWRKCASAEERFSWLLNNHASVCWSFVLIIVEESCQWLLKNPVNGCWTSVPWCQHCWTIVPANVEQSFKWLVKNCAAGCQKIMPMIINE